MCAQKFTDLKMKLNENNFEFVPKNLLWKCPAASGILLDLNRICCIWLWNFWIVLQLNAVEFVCVTLQHAEEWPKNITALKLKISNSLVYISFFSIVILWLRCMKTLQISVFPMNWYTCGAAAQLIACSWRCIEGDWIQLMEYDDK